MVFVVDLSKYLMVKVSWILFMLVYVIRV